MVYRPRPLHHGRIVATMRLCTVQSVSDEIARCGSTPALIKRYHRHQMAVSSVNSPSLTFVTTPGCIRLFPKLICFRRCPPPCLLGEGVSLDTAPPQTSYVLRSTAPSQTIHSPNKSRIEIARSLSWAISSRRMAFVPTTTESTPSHSCLCQQISNDYAAYLVIFTTASFSLTRLAVYAQ